MIYLGSYLIIFTIYDPWGCKILSASSCDLSGTLSQEIWFLTE